MENIKSNYINLGLILLLPVYKVKKLRMPVQRKLAVTGIFGLGALVTITGIIRLRVVIVADASPKEALTHGSSRTIRPGNQHLYYEH